MSNHYHLLMSIPDAQRMANFVGYLNSNVARELGRMHDWTDRFWSKRYQAIIVSDEEPAHESRMKYILSQGVKEGLVSHPARWPGTQSTQTLLKKQTVLTGHWRNRTREFHALASNQKGLVFRSVERIHLTPLPCWADRSAGWISKRVQELIELVQQECTDISVGNLPNPSPTQRPAKLKRSPAPLFHCTTKVARKLLYEAYCWFVTAYREASRQLKAGNLLVAFPEGSFPPPRPFVPT